MIENTIENKSKFFAQYYGQKVLGKNKFSYQSVCANLFKDDIDGVFIELTPLSQITDEDAIEVAKIFGTLEDEIFVGKWLVIGMFDNSADCAENKLYNSNAEAIDYLRSKSYLLPFNNTSIEKIIEYGWVKTTPN